MNELRWRRAALVLGASVAVAVGVGLLIGRAAGYARLADSLGEAAGWWLAVSAAAVAVEYLAGYPLALADALRWEGGPRLPAGLAARLSLASLGATRLSPAGVAGLAVLYWVGRRLGLDAARSVARVLGLNTVVYGVFGLGAAVAAVAAGGAPAAMRLAWIAAVGFCLVAFLVVTARPALARAEGSWPRRGFAHAVSGALLARREASRRGFGGAALYWAADVASLWAALRAFDVRLAVPVLVLAYATGYAASMLPLPLSGAGGVDAAMTYALVAVGVALAPALLAVFAYRLFSFWLPVAPGLVSLALLPTLGERLSAAGTVSPPAPARPGP